MPSYQTLKLTGDFDLQVEIEFEEIQRYYGSGYDTTVRTGHSAGVLHFKLVYKVLSGSQGQKIHDDESGTDKAPADYVWDAFVNRKADGQPFYIKNPRTGTDVLVKFTDRRLSFTLFAVKLFSSGITLRQFRPLS